MWNNATRRGLRIMPSRLIVKVFQQFRWTSIPRYHCRRQKQKLCCNINAKTWSKVILVLPNLKRNTSVYFSWLTQRQEKLQDESVYGQPVWRCRPCIVRPTNPSRFVGLVINKKSTYLWHRPMTICEILSWQLQVKESKKSGNKFAKSVCLNSMTI